MRTFFSVAFFLPLLTCGPILVFIRAISMSDMMKMAMTPMNYIGAVIFNIIIPFILYTYYENAIIKYDGSQASVVKTNRMVRNFEAISILAINLNGAAMFIFTTISCRMQGIEYDPLVWFLEGE